MIYPCMVLDYICGPRLVMISQKLRPVSLRFWTVTLSFQDEYRRLRLGGHTVTPWPTWSVSKILFLRSFLQIFPNFLVRISLPLDVKNFQNGCRIEILAIFQNAIYWYSSHTLTLAILMDTFCAFEWRSNLKIDRVMAISRFDLRVDLVTYLFDLWPHNNNISICGAIFHMWTKIGDD